MGILGTGIAIAGAALGSGDKPVVPPYPTINLDALQTDTIKANLAALPEAEKLASATNTYNAEQLQKMWQNILPQYNQMLSMASGNIMDQLKGNIPMDVSAAVKRSSAGRALAGGYGEGGMKENLTARDLGLTSLDISNRALSSMASFLATLKSTSLPTPMSPATMMLTPEQRYVMQAKENAASYQNQLLRNQIEAMPDPFMAAVGQILEGAGGSLAGMGMQNAFANVQGPSAMQSNYTLEPGAGIGPYNEGAWPSMGG